MGVGLPRRRTLHRLLVVALDLLAAAGGDEEPHPPEDTDLLAEGGLLEHLPEVLQVADIQVGLCLVPPVGVIVAGGVFIGVAALAGPRRPVANFRGSILPFFLLLPLEHYLLSLKHYMGFRSLRVHILLQAACAPSL